jgi:uncharacterized protein (TIGR02678 family)
VADSELEPDLLADLGDVEATQVVRCARVLLRRPLLREGGPDGELLPLVFKHRGHLVRLFSRHLGYRLRAERRFARLYKPAPADLPARGEALLSSRGYTYFALALAVLVSCGQQVLISRLVADVRAAAAEADIRVDDSLLDLRALGAALRHLQDLGILTEVEGSIAPWASGETPEALLSVDTEVLGLLVAAAVPTGGEPESILSAARLVGQPTIAQQVRQRLVEDPAVLYADLSAQQAVYLRRHHRHEGYLLERYFGLQPEFRAEGVLATDPEEYLTDVRLPATNAAARLTLLVLQLLLDEAVARPEDARYPVALTQLNAACADLVTQYPAAFGKDADAQELAGRVTDLLVRTGLARSHGESALLLSPVVHRWAPVADARGPASKTEPRTEASDAAQLDLFALEEDT